MKTNEQVNEHSTVTVYTYRYYWKTVKGKLCVKYLTGPLNEHADFKKAISEDPNIESCLREYVSQIDFAYLGFTEAIKEKKKEKEVLSDVLSDEETVNENIQP